MSRLYQNLGWYAPDRECREETRRATIEQAVTDLHVERRTNGSADTNQLNVPWFELLVG